MKIIRTILILACAVFAWQAAGQQKTPSFFSHVEESISGQKELLPQEKVHLHTDKPSYVSGEKIWMRAYVADASTHTPFSLSRYVYVELVNPANMVVKRTILRNEDNVCHGNLPLPENLPEGSYTLRAYTHFMCNVDEGYFCRQPVLVVNPQSKDIGVTLSATYPEPDVIDVRLSFAFENPNSGFDPKKVELRFNDRPVLPVRDGGDNSVTFTLCPEKDETDRMIYMNYDGYRRYFSVPYPDYVYDVTFYPEGGYLAPGSNCRMAFKALKPDGAPETVTGNVIYDEGRTVTSFSTFHDGMGWIDFMPEAGRTYRAECENAQGAARTFDLHAADPSAYPLRIDRDGKYLCVSVGNARTWPRGEPLYLLVHLRGEVLYADSWANPAKHKIFSLADFPSGVVQVLLLDNGYNVLSERLVFSDADDQASATAAADKPAYNTREKVKLDIRLADVKGLAPNSSLSVSVTDDADVSQRGATSIKAAMLLDSDLRGYIRNPDYYFEERDATRTAALELLMLTHGWRRYDMGRVMKGDFTEAELPLEVGQEISGTVTAPGRKKAISDAEVSVVSPQRNFFHQVRTDSTGRFYLRNFEFPDSTQYVVQALNVKGMPRVELSIDERSYPEVLESIPPVGTETGITRDYIAKSDRMYLMENGVRLINLDKIQVTGKRQDRTEVTGIYSHLATNSFKPEDIAEIDATCLHELFRRVPGVQVRMVKGEHAMEEKIFIRTTTVVGTESDGAALLFVDGVEMSENFELHDIQMADVARVDVFRNSGSTMMFGSKGRHGVVSITTKRGDFGSRPAEDRFNIERVVPPSFQEPVEFYAPKYDTPARRASTEPDLRTTIHWEPDVTVGDTGQVSIEFYTSDTPGTYTVVIEGMTDDGRTVTGRGRVDVK